MAKKKCAKKKKSVSSNLSKDNPTKDGIINPHGSTAGGRPHSGGNFMNGNIIHGMSPSVTRHQAVIFTSH